jgi:hypothetical protein
MQLIEHAKGVHTIYKDIVFFQIEKCKVCGTEYGYKVTHEHKVEMPLDYVKGLFAFRD